MNPTEREEILKILINTIESELIRFAGKRVNFVLVIGEDEGPDAFFVSHLSNTLRPLASKMLEAVYKKELT